MMGTLVKFTIVGVSHQQAETAIQAAADAMQRVEAMFTIYGRHDNSVKAFNRSTPGDTITLAPEVDRLLQHALAIQAASHGAFNPLLGSLDLLWGFSADPPLTTPPPADSIAAAIPPPACIEKQRGGWVRNSSNCKLDFGGIAKGYAIDRGIAVLKEQGIQHAIINAGGDIRLIGRHGDRPWRIGIRDPRHKGEVIRTLELEGDVSVVTSGDYERFYIYKGKRYHHILDPSSGYPARGIRSATIIAPTATEADGWSTALFILGTKGIALAEAKGYKVLLVDAKGELHGALTPLHETPVHPQSE